jgi:hypothetical protein
MSIFMKILKGQISQLDSLVGVDFKNHNALKVVMKVKMNQKIKMMKF